MARNTMMAGHSLAAVILLSCVATLLFSASSVAGAFGGRECKLEIRDFVGFDAPSALLNDDWTCRACGRLVADHKKHEAVPMPSAPETNWKAPSMDISNQAAAQPVDEGEMSWDLDLDSALKPQRSGVVYSGDGLPEDAWRPHAVPSRESLAEEQQWTDFSLKEGYKPKFEEFPVATMRAYNKSKDMGLITPDYYPDWLAPPATAFEVAPLSPILRQGPANNHLRRRLKWVYMNDQGYMPLLGRQGSDQRLVSLLARLVEAGQDVYLRQLCHYDELEEDVKQFWMDMGVTLMCFTVHDHEDFPLAPAGRTLVNLKPDVVIIPLWFFDRRFAVYERLTGFLRRQIPTARIAVLSDYPTGLRETTFWGYRHYTLVRSVFEDGISKHLAENANEIPHENIRAFLMDKFRNVEKEIEIHADYMTKLEAQCQQLADVTIATTEIDQLVFMNNTGFGPDRVRVLRYTLPWMTTHEQDPYPSDEELRAKPAVGGSYDERKDVVFIGGKHDANHFALNIFVRQCWNKISERVPGIKLKVYGGMAVDHLQSYPGVEAAGFVEDLDAAMQEARVFLAWKAGGNGVSTKTIMGLKNGVPIVSNTVGAAGYPNLHGNAGLVAHDIEQSCDYVVEAYTNKPLWEKLAKGGEEYLAAEFNANVGRQETADLVDYIASLGPRDTPPADWKTPIVGDWVVVREMQNMDLENLDVHGVIANIIQLEQLAHIRSDNTDTVSLQAQFHFILSLFQNRLKPARKALWHLNRLKDMMRTDFIERNAPKSGVYEDEVNADHSIDALEKKMGEGAKEVLEDMMVQVDQRIAKIQGQIDKGEQEGWSEQ